MLLLHEIHTVAGKHEDEFAAAFRDGWMPTLAGDDDARLLYFLRLAHGSGRAYHVVTITGLRDGAAYERLATRVQHGDLRSWAADVDRSGLAESAAARTSSAENDRSVRSSRLGA